jgi:ABC-type phosphate/phosphonate transport system substrate-binding protein
MRAPIIFTVFLAFSGALAQAADPKEPIRVGLLSSFFHDVPESSKKTSMESFKQLMKREIDRDGVTTTLNDPFQLAKQLADKKLQIGVFHGFEYAWVKKAHPELNALVVAVNEEPKFRSLVLVGKESPAKEFLGLQGKALALPIGSREESRVYLDGLCRKAGKERDKFFSSLTKPANLEDALDDVVDNVVQATVIDAVSLARYKQRKPARFEKLKVLTESVVFPVPVVVYPKGALDEETAKQLRKALIKASASADGKQMLMTWKMTAFREVPDKYDEWLVEVLKEYPPPTKKE